MTDDPTGPDLQRIISILLDTDATNKLFETIRPLDLPTGEKPPPTPPEILAMLREAQAPSPYDPDPLPTDPAMLKARLEMASWDRHRDSLTTP